MDLTGPRSGGSRRVFADRAAPRNGVDRSPDGPGILASNAVLTCAPMATGGLLGGAAVVARGPSISPSESLDYPSSSAAPGSLGQASHGTALWVGVRP